MSLSNHAPPAPGAEGNRARRLAFEVSAILRQLALAASELGLGPEVAEVEALRDKVESQVFTVGIVGEFRRGKSTLINALLGDAILPSDVLPTSAVVTRVVFGPEPRATLIGKPAADGTSTREVIPLEKLPEFITHITPESRERAARLQEVIVEYPTPWCLNHNMEIVDTPGLSDETALTLRTMESLGRMDAVVFVIMAGSPFAETEARFLKEVLLKGIARVFLVVSGVDRLRNAEEIDRVLKHVRERVEEGIDEIVSVDSARDVVHPDALRRDGKHLQVFGLSGYLALEAKTTNSKEKLDASRITIFERHLKMVLSAESHLLALRSQVTQMLGITRWIREREQQRAVSRQCDEERNLKSLRTAEALNELMHSFCRTLAQELAGLQQTRIRVPPANFAQAWLRFAQAGRRLLAEVEHLEAKAQSHPPSLVTHPMPSGTGTAADPAACLELLASAAQRSFAPDHRTTPGDSQEVVANVVTAVLDSVEDRRRRLRLTVAQRSVGLEHRVAREKERVLQLDQLEARLLSMRREADRP